MISGSHRYCLCIIEISEITGGLISEITGEPGPKRSRRKNLVDQKGSWPSIPGKGPTRRSRNTQQLSLWKSSARIKRLSELRVNVESPLEYL